MGDKMCRVCAQTPFGAFFGFNSGEGDEDGDADDASTSQGYDPLRFSPRSQRQREERSETWFTYLHPRARDLFGEDSYKAKTQACFDQLLEYTDRRDDPVCGEKTKCVLWRGPLHVQDGTPVLVMPTDKDRTAEVRAVRVLAFLFADSRNFVLLADLSNQEQLEMVCENPQCVNLRHIVVPPTSPLTSPLTSPASETHGGDGDRDRDGHGVDLG